MADGDRYGILFDRSSTLPSKPGKRTLEDGGCGVSDMKLTHRPDQDQGVAREEFPSVGKVLEALFSRPASCLGEHDDNGRSIG